MNPTQFNLTNDPDSHCLAVYQDKNTGLIERSLIVSPALFDSKAYSDSLRYSVIVSLQPEGFYKEIMLRDIDSIIVTRIQWLQGDKLVNSQRTGL